MLYTPTPAPHQAEQVVLFFSPQEARLAAVAGHPVCGVSVHYDSLMKRLIPSGSPEPGVDRSWMAPAEWHSGGSIVARGPIPEPLFFRWAG